MRTALLLLLVCLVAIPVSAQTIVGDRFLLKTGPCTIRSGSGSPEGVVVGAVCDSYYQTNSPYDVWRKTSGSGNTGWVTVTITPAALTRTDDTNVTITLGGTPSLSLLAATSMTVGWTGTLAAPRGGTGQSSYAVGDVLYAPTTSTVGKLAAVATGQVLASAGVNTAPAYTASPSLTSISGAANLTLNPVGDLILNPTGNDVLPTTNYDINFGSINFKYLTVHAAESWIETLVSLNKIGTIGGRLLVGSTNILVIDLPTGSTPDGATFKYNDFSAGDIIYMESDGKVEFFSVISGPTGGAGAYVYQLNRNVDGTGQNQWYAGDAAFNTGVTGDGFIDLYSLRGVNPGSPTEFGPTIAGNVRLSSTFNDWAPRWAIGNLNGLYNYSATTFGAAFGDATNTNVTVDATNGFRIRSGTTNKFLADTSGNLSIVGDLSIGTAGVIRSNATAFGTGTGYWLAYNAGTPQFRVGTTAGNRISWDGTDLTIIAQDLTIDSSGLRLPTASVGTALSSVSFITSNGWMQLGAQSSSVARTIQLTSVYNGTALDNFLQASGLTASATGSTTSFLYVRSGRVGSTPYHDILTQGLLLLGTGQVEFPATQNPSSDINTLDDYEEGSWTPVIGGTTSESGQSYTSQVGFYTKVGRLVHAQMYVELSNKGTITGNAVIKGLPFTSRTDTNGFSGCSVGFFSLASNVVLIEAYVAPNSTRITLVDTPVANTTVGPINQSEIANTTGFVITCSYMTID